MENHKYLQDLHDIKTMMHRSSRFISLSGLSGVLAGVYALVGAFFAYRVIYFEIQPQYISRVHGYIISTTALQKLLMIAAVVLIASIATGILLSYRKSKHIQESLWNGTAKRLVINFGIPLMAGGVFILALISRGNYGLIAPATLIFYGLACINASKYTLGDIRYLGISVLLLGLLNAFFVGYGLLFWALGFGGFHILYGGLMYFKYDVSDKRLKD